MSTTPVYMSDKIYNELVELLRKTYPNVCVLYIDRISNKALEKKFEARRLTFENKSSTKLFHGTQSGSVASIITNGYKSCFTPILIQNAH